MPYDVTQQELVVFKHRRIGRPHVVILGAGASLAAFPTGDARGTRLPLMANLVEVLDLTDAIAKAGLSPVVGFESLYSRLHAVDPRSSIVQLIEQRVREYFGSLVLPDAPTLYDLLLLSLRSKDAVFTFNWDPFLVDAYERLAPSLPMPHIYHLHGNVRVGFCLGCGVATKTGRSCPECGEDVVPTRLLYPVEKKNCADDPFIASQWQQARDFIGRAGIITIFGYSAPTTDKEAMEIMKEAWKGDGPEKPVERVQIIDIRDSSELSSQWSSFAFYGHYDIRRSFYDSMLFHYPRRSCEALVHSGFDGKYVEIIKWVDRSNALSGALDELVESVSELVAYEGKKA